MEELLDNAVFNGLRTGNSHLSTGTENVKFFLPDVSPFAGIRRFDAACFEELFNSIPQGEKKLLKLPEDVPLPGYFTVSARYHILQMLGTRVSATAANGDGIRNLTETDLPEMIALTKKMNPGPFSQRTILFGHYRGIFQQEKLVSMAGRRFHPGRFVEISAVCTDPEFGGLGYGKKLVEDQIGSIVAGGELPFLHVMADRERPIRLYSKLGFETRRKFFVYLISGRN